MFFVYGDFFHAATSSLAMVVRSKVKSTILMVNVACDGMAYGFVSFRSCLSLCYKFFCGLLRLHSIQRACQRPTRAWVDGPTSEDGDWLSKWVIDELLRDGKQEEPGIWDRNDGFCWNWRAGDSVVRINILVGLHCWHQESLKCMIHVCSLKSGRTLQLQLVGSLPQSYTWSFLSMWSPAFQGVQM